MNNKILFVDDDVKVLNGYKRSYRRKYDIVTAESGRQGLQDIENLKGEFAVIISDMKMPEMNGLEFLSQAKQLSPKSIMIMLTGNAELSVAHEALKEGVIYEFLTKPCKQEDLIQIIDQALECYDLKQ